MITIVFFLFFYFCGSYTLRWIKSINHEQPQKIRIWRYYFIHEIDYDKLWDSKIFSTRGPRGKKIDDIMTNFEIPKKLVVLIKESR